LNGIKVQLLELDSLPPICKEIAASSKERAFAREVFELAVVLSIHMDDKASFEKYMSTLRPYYTTTGFGTSVTESENKYTILGLNLLYLLVENRLSDFHCELELLSEEQQAHEYIRFCTQLDQRLVLGAYDQVMSAAAKPPVELYSFFLKSLLETVRLNICECAEASYHTLQVTSAQKILMCASKDEVLAFVGKHYPDWNLQGETFHLKPSTIKAATSEDVSSLSLISQTLSYATELERIV
jgi:26S proteasome regulatory subunit N12